MVDHAEELPVITRLGLPPVSADIVELIEPYLQIDHNSLHTLRSNVKTVECPRDIHSLLEVNPTQVPLTLKVQRDPATGRLLSYDEVITSSTIETSLNSLSLNRALGKKTDGLKGCSANLPFWPGGFDEEKEKNEKDVADKLKNMSLEVDKEESQLFKEVFEDDLLCIPPGFQEGVDFGSEGKEYHKSLTINQI